MLRKNKMTVKEIQNLKFIGRGSNGYWKLEE